MKTIFLDSEKKDAHAAMRRDDKLKRLLNNKILVAAFAVFVALLALASAASVIGAKKGNETSAPVDTLALQGAEVNSSAAQSLNANFLLAVCDEDERTVRLLACLSADSEKGSFEIEYIPSTQLCSVNSVEGTIESHFKNSGTDGLIWAVRASGHNVDRYVLIDEDNAVKLFKAFGEQEIDVQKRVKHDYKGVSFIIEKGVQKFTAETLMKYFAYLCDSGAAEKESITGLVSHYLALAFSSKDMSITERYDNMVNLMTTDISALDIATYGPILATFVGEG